MSQFTFCSFADCEDGKMARLETAESMIPVNVFIDNAFEIGEVEEDSLCTVDVCGVGGDFQVYASEEAYRAAKNKMAAVALIPIGTFSPRPDDEDFEESPHILFSGKVLEVEWGTEVGENEPNCRIRIETVDFAFDFFVRYDGQIEEGYYVHGVAWLFGNMTLPEGETA